MSVDTSPGSSSGAPRPSVIQRIMEGMANVEWKQVLLVALVMAFAWCSLFMTSPMMQILAGIIPVMGGLYLGNRVKGHYLSNGIMLGVAGFLFGLIIVVIYGSMIGAGMGVPLPQITSESGELAPIAGADDLVAVYFFYSLFALVPFPAFGAVMAGRTQQRNLELRRELDERGGRLERPGVIRTLEDLRGLSLPQFGMYVSNLYKKKGFTFHDYRFVDKDKHLDIEMEYNNERYLMRLSVADKVRVGTVESLIQDMRRRDILKGLVITSTEFAPETIKAAANKRNLITIDGPTLFAMAEA
ncbi:restriction endonuclease [Candidatus Oscillochloris fontis]|uniref:restriction endonuclease n=1 Tax=Candidatus Oscillochloris fontis TaxID=2496868 RepID=UPI0015814852|nr:restriction endonuclease [Candidatus Oscillochloris fontis]